MCDSESETCGAEGGRPVRGRPSVLKEIVIEKTLFQAGDKS